ncbi:MAG: hypothetical protein ACK5YL_00605 [Holosporales bacterium]|jgi:hypothetical protein
MDITKMIIAGIAATSVNATICATPAARSTEGFFEAKKLIETTQKACKAEEADNIVKTGLSLSIIAELNNALRRSDTSAIKDVKANVDPTTGEGAFLAGCKEPVKLPPGTNFSQLFQGLTQGRG